MPLQASSPPGPHHTPPRFPVDADPIVFPAAAAAVPSIRSSVATPHSCASCPSLRCSLSRALHAAAPPPSLILLGPPPAWSAPEQPPGLPGEPRTSRGTPHCHGCFQFAPNRTPAGAQPRAPAAPPQAESCSPMNSCRPTSRLSLATNNLPPSRMYASCTSSSR